MATAGEAAEEDHNLLISQVKKSDHTVTTVRNETKLSRDATGHQEIAGTETEKVSISGNALKAKTRRKWM